MDKLIRDMEQAGYDAKKNGGHSAPGLNPHVREALAAAPVGEPRTIEIMQAFSRGFKRRVSEDLRELGYDF